ncbi:TetR/AcrR family transcriptional regulator [Kitasatospora sp. NBC_00315]|uniref:TetR/AcrR family transcriptional regulator n=1 Tax=Kitasatospora sp. NBC_00315 TaxID=2975963 RepID=UPI00324739AB
MSPRQIDPTLGPQLVETAARLLAEEGPKALSTRRLAAEVGTSTMAVYTHFGGKDDLVRAMVREGFGYLDRRLTEVAQTADPVADVAALGWAYRSNALEHRHLYSVMFGGSGFGGFALTDDDRQHGRYTLGTLVRTVGRCMEAGRLRSEDELLVAHQLWIALHGLVTLELGGYLIPPYDADACFEAQVGGILVGEGDDAERTRASLLRARERRA